MPHRNFLIYLKAHIQILMKKNISNFTKNVFRRERLCQYAPHPLHELFIDYESTKSSKKGGEDVLIQPLAISLPEIIIRGFLDLNHKSYFFIAIFL